MKDALRRWLGLANTPAEVPAPSASTRPSPADATVPRGCYVYAHESLDGDVFYIGKGTGRRAWVRGRDMLWELYVTERLGGEYRVRVLEDGLSEDEALEQEEAWMAHYGDALVNRQNMSRGLDMEAFEREHALRDEVESVHAQAIVEQDAGQRVILARRALDLHYQSTQACSEKGVVGELLRANPMGHMRLLDVLVSAHLELGEADQARAALQDYAKTYAQDARSVGFKKLEKLVERGKPRRKVAEVDFTPPQVLPPDWEWRDGHPVLRADLPPHGIRSFSRRLDRMRELLKEDPEAALVLIKRVLAADAKRSDPECGPGVVLWGATACYRLGDKLQECLRRKAAKLNPGK